MLAAKGPERIFPIRQEFLFHRQHSVPTQNAVHFGFSGTKILDRKNKEFQLHAMKAAVEIAAKKRKRLKTRNKIAIST